MKKSLIAMILTVLMIYGCSVFHMPPANKAKGDDVVCILFKDKRFKTGVVGNLTGALSGKGYKIVTGSVKQAKYFKASDYGAVVYMAELWAWHTPLHAKRYYRNNDQAKNIVFVITSADPDVVIKKPFDAVTSASEPDKIEPVAREILDRLERILR